MLKNFDILMYIMLFYEVFDLWFKNKYVDFAFMSSLIIFSIFNVYNSLLFSLEYYYSDVAFIDLLLIDDLNTLVSVFGMYTFFVLIPIIFIFLYSIKFIIRYKVKPEQALM
ncbi:MAG: hypothetical protein R3Y12_07895 [Clostridia bacterium]